MGIQIVAILFYLYYVGILPSCLHGYAQPCMASDAFTNSELWYYISIRSYNYDRNDVPFPFKDKMVYQLDVSSSRYRRVDIWRACRCCDRLVGYRSVLA